MVNTSLKRVMVLLAGLISITAFGAASGRWSDTSLAEADAVTDPAHETEVARIRVHLAGAERLLIDADVSGLTSAQRSARSRNIAVLHGYRERGIFPRNVDFPGSRQPYFVDDRGVLCAMAYLIAASGRSDIVERIRATRNNARIRELVDDTALVAWLNGAGLTAAEAARIQPAYDYPDNPIPSKISRPMASEYAVASAASSLLTGAGIILNLPRTFGPPSGWRGVLAVMSGSVGLALGVPRMGGGDGARNLAIWNTSTGALSLGLGTHTLLRRTRGRLPAAVPASAPQPDKIASGLRSKDFGVNVVPMVGTTPGVRFHVEF